MPNAILRRQSTNLPSIIVVLVCCSHVWWWRTQACEHNLGDILQILSTKKLIFIGSIRSKGRRRSMIREGAHSKEINDVEHQYMNICSFTQIFRGPSYDAMQRISVRIFVRFHTKRIFARSHLKNPCMYDPI